MILIRYLMYLQRRFPPLHRVRQVEWFGVGLYRMRTPSTKLRCTFMPRTVSYHCAE